MCSMLLLPQLAPKNYTSRILRLSVPVPRVSMAQVTMRANSIWWLNFHTVRTASDWLTVGIKGSWLTTNSNCFQYGKIYKSQQTFSVWFIFMDLYIYLYKVSKTHCGSRVDLKKLLKGILQHNVYLLSKIIKCIVSFQSNVMLYHQP